MERKIDLKEHTNFKIPPVRIFFWLWLVPILLGFSMAALNNWRDLQRYDLLLFSIGFQAICAGANAWFDVGKFWNGKRYQIMLTNCTIVFIALMAYTVAVNLITGESDNFRNYIFQSLLGLANYLCGYYIVRSFESENDKEYKFDDPVHYYLKLICWIFVPQTLIIGYMLIADNLDHDPEMARRYVYLVPVYCLGLTLGAFISVWALTRLRFFRRNLLALIFVSGFCSFMTFNLLSMVTLPSHWTFQWSFAFPGLYSAAATVFLLRKRESEKQKDQHIRMLDGRISKNNLEYQRLRQQTNPHFFFNNLNTLLSYIESDPQKALVFGRQLSNVYRKFLRHDDQDFIPLGEELAFASEYLGIYQAKFGKALQIKFETGFASADYILADVLQEVIDNIFKHNVLEEEYPMEIEIFANDGYLKISNSLYMKTDVISDKTGLNNIRKRHEMLIGRSIKASSTPTHFIVHIPILKQE